MTLQFQLDFTQKLPPAAQAKIEAGMRQADDNANPKWRHIFDAAVLAAARKKPEITSDDVLTELELMAEHADVPSTHNLSAIGPAMKRAGKMGVITPTERTMRSALPHKNGNLHVIWTSNYYEGRSA
jgi:hypothetical protein